MASATDSETVRDTATIEDGELPAVQQDESSQQSQSVQQSTQEQSPEADVASTQQGGEQSISQPETFQEKLAKFEQASEGEEPKLPAKEGEKSTFVIAPRETMGAVEDV